MPPRKQAALRANGLSRVSKLPGIKHNAPRSTAHFFPLDSDDSVADDTPQKKRAQPSKKTRSILGGTNSLKAMFSNSQEPPKEDEDPSPDTTPIKKPAKRGRKPKKAAASPQAPIHEASTPKSMLKRATKLLELPENTKPFRFDDIEDARLPRRPKAPRQKEKSETLPKKRRKKQVEDDDEYVEQHSQHTLQLTDSERPGPVRRSSYSNRGKRVLSVGNGFVAKPHDEMSARDYFKVVDGSLPGPSRMRQILVWCFKKKLQQDREKDGPETDTAKGIAKVIQSEILEDLVGKKIDTSWLLARRFDTAELQGKRIIKSNPLNDANRESVEVFQQKLRELRQEKVLWQNAFDASVKPLEGLGVNNEDEEGKYSREFKEYVKQKDPALGAVLQEEHLEALSQHVQQVEAGVSEKLETNMAQLFHTAYQLSKSVELVGKIKNELLAPQVTQIVKDFMERGRHSEEVTKIGARELLRGISRVDLRQ